MHTYTEPQTSSTRSRGLGWRIHGSVEDTKLSTNKQHSLSLSKAWLRWTTITLKSSFLSSEMYSWSGVMVAVGGSKQRGHPCGRWRRRVCLSCRRWVAGSSLLLPEHFQRFPRGLRLASGLRAYEVECGRGSGPSLCRRWCSRCR